MNKLLVNIVSIFLLTKKSRHKFRDKYSKKKAIEFINIDGKIDNIISMTKTINERNSFDVVIPCKISSVNELLDILPQILKNILPNNIIIITKYNNEYFEKLSKIKYIKIVDEDKIFEELTIDKVKEKMIEKTGTFAWSGWYFQQFLKMSYAFLCQDQYYLVWDADTMPINNLNFFKDNKAIFNMKIEHHIPYFETLKKILNIDKQTDNSFIAEHIMVDKNIMIELIEKIKNNDSLKGESFWEKIFNSIDLKYLQSFGFSEYETYGNYVLTYHEDKYLMNRLRTLRDGYNYFSAIPPIQLLNEVAKNFDTVTFESYHKKNNKLPLENYLNEVIKENEKINE